MIDQRFNVRLFTLASLAALSVVINASAAAPTSPPIAITNVSIFDAVKAGMLPPQTVIIQGERIKAVGVSAPIPPGADILDGEGQFLIPGLIDAHIHLVHLADRNHVTAIEFLPMFLGAGVTSVRSTGDTVEIEKRIAEHVDQRPESYPRIFLASPLIDGDPPLHKDVGLAVTTLDQATQLVDQCKKAGVTTLKIYVGTSREIGQRVIEEGHRQGLVVTGHLGRYSAQDAVADGIDCLEHIWGIIDFIVPRGQTRANVDLSNPKALQLIAAVKEQGVAVNPTLVVFRDAVLLGDQVEYNRHPDNLRTPERMRLAWERGLNGPPNPMAVELRREEFRKYQELTGVLYRAGVTLLAGSDAPEPFVCPGFSLHQELELLVESGLPPGAALQCATLNNARILNQEKELGSVEPGKLADLVLLRKNPLDDVRHTRHISKVIRGGRVLDPDEVLHCVPEK
jgi:hypothetical protein